MEQKLYQADQSKKERAGFRQEIQQSAHNWSGKRSPTGQLAQPLLFSAQARRPDSVRWFLPADEPRKFPSSSGDGWPVCYTGCGTKRKPLGRQCLGGFFSAGNSRKIALDYLKENKVTFPIILDVTPAAREAMNQYLTLPDLGADPMTYVIGRDGKIVDGWFGYDSDRTKAAVEKLGL